MCIYPPKLRASSHCGICLMDSTWSRLALLMSEWLTQIPHFLHNLFQIEVIWLGLDLHWDLSLFDFGPHSFCWRWYCVILTFLTFCSGLTLIHPSSLTFLTCGNFPLDLPFDLACGCFLTFLPFYAELWGKILPQFPSSILKIALEVSNRVCFIQLSV